MRRATLLIGLLALGIVCPGEEKARAAESAAGIYLLGAKGSMAGYVPPPGTYLTDYNYFYSGDATGEAALGVALRRTGNFKLQVDIKVEGTVALEAPTFIWVAPQKVLGGNLGLGAIIPVGWKKVDVGLDALATLTLPPPLNITLTKGRHFDFDEDTLASAIRCRPHCSAGMTATGTGRSRRLSTCPLVSGSGPTSPTLASIAAPSISPRL